MNKIRFIKLLFSFYCIIAIAFTLAPAKAVTDGTFRIVPPNNGNLIQECKYALDVRINTGNNNSNSADIIIDFDPSRVEILDSLGSQSGVQIKPGTAYQAYFGNIVDQNAGRIRLTGASFGEHFRGEGLFATIEFKGKPAVTNASFTIKFDGASPTNTYDSNIAIAENSQDALGSVTNANVNFVPGGCVSDTTAPNINFINPKNNQSNVPTNQTITLNLTDNLSGVNLSTLEIIVNGVVFRANSPEVTITGTPNNYTVTIINNNLFYPNSPSNISVKVSDNAGNSRLSNISFNFPPPSPTPLPPTATPQPPVSPTPSPIIDSIPPVIEFVSPISRGTLLNNGQVVINISDGQSGVNLNNLVIVINERRYTINDATLKAVGDKSKYTITITDTFDFSKIASSFMSVYVTDLAGNFSNENIVFNISQQVVEEDKLVCTNDGEKNTSKVDILTNPPLKNNVDTLQKNVENLVPSIAKPVVEETGIFGIASLIASIPLLGWLISILTSFLAGGLLFPFLRSLFIFGYKNNYGLVIDSESKEGLQFAQLIIRESAKNEIIQKVITNRKGRYVCNLPAGEYVIQVTKKGYTEQMVSLKLESDEDVKTIIELEKLNLEDISSDMQLKVFNINPIAVSMYFGLTLSILNVLYVRTLVAYIILIVILLFVILAPKRIKKLKKEVNKEYS